MKVPNIIAIIGESGSGKTYAANYLSELNIPLLVSYTTRPMRDGEINGKDHWFVSPEDFPGLDDPDILAHMDFNGYHYWTSYQQMLSIANENNTVLYVVDESGLADLLHRQLSNNDIFVTSIYIFAEPEVRIARGVSPERIERDRKRVHFNRWVFDFSIENNGSVAEFQEALDSLINKLMV